MIKECLKMSWEHIKTERLRSFLTMLGVIIGVTSVIALITIIQGVTGEMMSRFESMGAETLTVTANGSVLKSGLNDNDIDKLLEVQYITGVSPSIQGSTAAVKDGIVMDTVTVKGKNDTYFKKNMDTILSGRALTPLDMSADSYVCLINEAIVDEAFLGKDPVGDDIIIGGHTYQIIGVVENDTSISAAFNDSDSSTPSVIIPYQNAMRLLGISSITSLEVYFSDSTKSDEVISNLEATLDKIFNYKDDTYSVRSMESMLESMEQTQTMLTAMLAGIASISLLVGGIGIMNMMLVSVSERRKEIGLRKALGTEPGQIQLQFGIEAIFLSLMGGLIGIALGLLISWIVSIAIGTSISPSLGAIILGVGFSSGVGILFGWAPAKKASRLNPIDALRSE